MTIGPGDTLPVVWQNKALNKLRCSLFGVPAAPLAAVQVTVI